MMLTQGKLDSLHEVSHREVVRRHEARLPRVDILYLDLVQALLDMEVHRVGIG